jgi:diadenosine tetraphosphate (Ap4A) HIT family hydrolase
VNKSTACPFCALPQARLLFRNDSSIAFRDAYPVTPGHTLVIPRRHVSSFFDTTPEERTSMLGLLEAAKQQIQSEFDPAGYNIGINDGRQHSLCQESHFRPRGSSSFDELNKSWTRRTHQFHRSAKRCS